MTEDIIKAAAVLGIAVHDHVIIARNGHTSLRDLGLIPSAAKNTDAVPFAPISARHTALHEEN